MIGRLQGGSVQTTTGAILLVIGVVALFAAIVGGGVKIREIEVGSLPSRWRQVFLAIFGIVVGTIGLIMVTDKGDNGGSDVATQNTESLAGDANAPETGNEVSSGEQNPEDSNATETNRTEADNSSDQEQQQTAN
jgi:hypothetical protein